MGISMIRNDADIVEAFVRHSLRLLDHLFIIVHCPEDGTDQILKAMHEEKLPMTLVFDDEPAFLQGERLTWLARQAHAALPSDFIFPIDADEFIVPADRAIIESALKGIPSDMPAARIRLRTFVPTVDDPANELNPVRRIRYRVIDETRVDKVVLTPAFAADPSFVLAHGSHGLLRVGATGRQLPVPPLREIALAHYPVRSANQVINKTIIGYLAHIASGRPEFEELRIATHWRRSFEDLVCGTGQDPTGPGLIAWFHDRQSRAARPDELVCDPTPSPDELRYAHLVRNDPYATLARFTEHVIRKRPGKLDSQRFVHGPRDETRRPGLTAGPQRS
ncbi:MAG TPA: glycosyltransferase family 2 protein [Casimicrobiaceae bacterium]|nr:glycosyltransferase family 2 protein [Casimicrobiaceae bacterium]